MAYDILTFMNRMSKGSWLIRSWGEYQSGRINDIIDAIAQRNVSCRPSQQINYAVHHDCEVRDYLSTTETSIDERICGEESFSDILAEIGRKAWHQSNAIFQQENIDKCIAVSILSELSNIGFTELNRAQMDHLANTVFNTDESLETIIEIAVQEFKELED